MTLPTNPIRTPVPVAEDLWRRQFFTQQRGSPEESMYESTASELALLFRTVRQRGLQLPPPPKGWPTLNAGGLERLRLAAYVLQTIPDPSAQEQLNILADLPSSMEQVQAALAVPFALVDRALLDGQTPSHASREDVEGAFGLAQTELYALRLAVQADQRLPLQAYKDFFARLKTDVRHATWPLGEPEQVRLVKIVALASTLSRPSGSLPALIEWSDRMGSQLGRRAWHAIFQPRWAAQGETIAAFLSTCELTCALAQDIPLHDLLASLGQARLNLSSYRDQLVVRRQSLLNAQRPQRSLNSVVTDFAEVQAANGVALPAERLQTAAWSCQEVLSTLSTLTQLSEADLRGEVGILQERAAANKNWLAPADEARMLALACESLRRHMRITPYSTQIMTVLGLLNGRSAARGQLAQVKTGEGKSTIVTLLALVGAALGRKVDIISSSRPLAMRDQKRYAPLLRSWGLTSAHLCRDRTHHAEFLCNVVYGTNTDFEFSLLYDYLNIGRPAGVEGPTGRSMRPLDMVIVDEVDNLFIDQGRSSAIISTPQRDPNRWIVPPILKLVESWQTFSRPANPMAAARAMLRGCNTTDVAVKALSDDDLQRWLANAQTALLDKSEDVDYVLIDPAVCAQMMTEAGTPSADKITDKGKGLQVVLVDRNTGQLQLRSRWQDRLHQFVEAKHGLDIQDESLTAAEMSHPVFFSKYTDIFGVTGTMGESSERDEVRQMYGAETFDTPPYLPNQRIILPPLLCRQENDFLKTLTTEVATAKSADRPCLILMETIKESRTFSEHLRNQYIDHQVFNALQQEDEELIVARAGREGVITVATNMAGRGTDIVLTPGSRAAGGLHVVVAFYADNIRIEEQGMGRSARQGQPGSARLVVHTEPMNALLIPGDSINSVAGLEKLRARLLRQESAQRATKAAVDQVIHQFALSFYSDLKAWETQISDKLVQDESAAIAKSLWAKRTAAHSPSGNTAELSQSPCDGSLSASLTGILRTAVNADHCTKLCCAWLKIYRLSSREHYITTWGHTLQALLRSAQGWHQQPPSFIKEHFTAEAQSIYDAKLADSKMRVGDVANIFCQDVSSFVNNCTLA